MRLLDTFRAFRRNMIWQAPTRKERKERLSNWRRDCAGLANVRAKIQERIAVCKAARSAWASALAHVLTETRSFKMARQAATRALHAFWSKQPLTRVRSRILGELDDAALTA